MSALTNIVKKACLMMTGILMASTVKAAEPSTSSFDMEANGIAYRIFTAAPQRLHPKVAILSYTWSTAIACCRLQQSSWQKTLP